MTITPNYNDNFFAKTWRARFCFMILYVVANIYAYFSMTNNKELVGDFLGIGYASDTPVLWLLCWTLLSYYLICNVLFNLVMKIRINVYKIKHVSDAFGLFLLISQIAYMLFNLLSGANSAGTDFKQGGTGRLLWLLLPVDYIFYIYYVLARGKSNKIFYSLNALTFIASMLSRGWLGWVLIVAFIELCFIFSKGSLLKKIGLKNAILFLFLMLFFPIVFELKVVFRALILQQDWGGALTALLDIDPLQAYTNFFDSLSSRLQQLSNVIYIYERSDQLSELISSGVVANYYWESLFQQTLAKLIGYVPGNDIHVFLYSHYISESSEAVTNLQTGFISWMIINPIQSLFYLVYITLLIAISIFLSKKIGGQRVCALTWFFVFIYIMCGWLNAFIFYIQALFVVYICMNVSLTSRK